MECMYGIVNHDSHLAKCTIPHGPWLVGWLLSKISTVRQDLIRLSRIISCIICSLTHFVAWYITLKSADAGQLKVTLSIKNIRKATCASMVESTPSPIVCYVALSINMQLVKAGVIA